MKTTKNIKAVNKLTGLYYRKQTASFDSEYAGATLLSEVEFAVVKATFDNVERDFAAHGIQIEQAEARPWKMQKPRGPQHAIDRKWEIVSPMESGGEMVIVGEHTGIECLNEANAALIIRAVNEYDALVAVAEAAKNLEQTATKMLAGGFNGRMADMHKAVGESSEQVRASLATLAAVRGQK